MTKMVKAEDIAKLMKDNTISLHEVAKVMNCKAWIWCLEDFLNELSQRNADFGVEMSKEKALEIAKRAFDNFNISDSVGDFGYTMIRDAIQQKLTDAEEEVEKELNE